MIGNRDLEFTDENIRELYRSRYEAVPTDPDEFAEIVERSFRNPLYLSYMIDNSGHSEDSISQIISEAEHSLFQYMEHKFYNQLRREVREALLQLAMVGQFNVSMAEIVTAHQQIRQILEEMKQLGNFLANADNDTFYIRHFYLNFLAWKESVVMSRRQRESVYERAALYYEMNENMERALFYYKKAEDNDEILHLLTKISEENPEMMNFTEIGPYLENLSEENIQNTPQLMCGMSMMHSLRMNPRKAEEWYEKLREYADLCMPDSIERREADAMLRFLDIKLPHRSTDGLEEHLRNLTCYEAYYEHGGYRKASFSIGMPSALNGSLDLSDFVRGKVEKEENVLDIAEPVAHLFESDIHSTLRLSLAEWQYERNELQGRELEKILNEIYITACSVGDMELAFAAIAILAKSFMSRGDMRSAMEFFDRFIIRTKSFRDRHMKACIDAYYARMLMRQGDVSFAGDWLSKSPNSTEFFTIRDRYLYIQKVRVLIMMERYQEAHSLIERLELAFENYHRIILGIQNTCLKAILLFREGDANWENVLIQAMENLWK